MSRHALYAGLLLLSLAPPTALQAQRGTDPPRGAPARDSIRMTEPLGGYQVREGLWYGGSLGYGSFNCNGQGTGGFTTNLEGGWTLSRRIALGLGTSVWTRGFGRLGMSVGSVDLRARWYPSEMAGGLFFTGSFGLGFIRLTDDQADPTSITSTGRALRAGIGYDFRVANGVSVTTFGSGMKVNTEKEGDHMRAEVWQLGLGVTIH
jgi:hypothetical protein